MKKFAAVLFSVGCITLSVACGSNGPTVSGPDPVTVSAPEPVAVAPAPVPQTVVPPSGTFSATYFPNAGFQVTNLSGESKNYYAYYTSFDNQTTALGVITGLNTKNGKDFTGSFNKTCVQLDLTEEVTVVGGPGGRAFAYAYFDKQGKEISNANRNEKIAECRTPDPRPTPTPGPTCETTEAPELSITGEPAAGVNTFTGIGTVLPVGGSFNLTFPVTVNAEQTSASLTYTFVQVYGGELRCTRTLTKTFTLTYACATSSAQISGPSFPTYTPAVPAVPAQYFYYWDMDNGNGNTPKQNACEGRQGVWLGDDYDIPNDGSNNEYEDVCRTTFDGLSGQQGVDADFIKKVQTVAAVAAVPASGGNPISGGATFFSAGVWDVRLLATSSIGEYNSNNPDFVKDSDGVTLGCSGQGGKSVSYNWIGHSSEYWWIEVRLNGSFYSKSNYVTNPSN